MAMIPSLLGLLSNVTHLDCCKHRMGLADNSHNHGTLLDCLLRVFDLEDATLWRESHRIVVVVVSEHDEGESCGVMGTPLKFLSLG